MMDLKNINLSQWGLLIVMIIYIFYLTHSTTPVPNYNNATQEYLYSGDDYVPPTYVSNEIAGLGVILVIMLFFSTKVKDIQKGRITERQFKEIATKEIRKKQNIPLPDGSYEVKNWKFKVEPNVLSRYISEKGVRKLFKYIAQVTFTDNYDIEHYYLCSGDPITGMIDGLVPTDEKLSYMDKCPNCGRFPDEKLILPEEFKTLKDLKPLTQ